MLTHAAHAVHQDRLLARADRAADRAEAAVLRVWLDLLRAIKAGGHLWEVERASLAALHGLSSLGGVVADDLAAAVRDSAHWTADHLARNLPRRHRLALAARPRFVRPHLLHEEVGDTPDLLTGLLLPALDQAAVSRVVYASGWLARLRSLTALATPAALAARIASAVARGLAVQQIAREIRPVVQGVQASARRVARTAGLWVAHEAELATYDELGEMSLGYTVHAVLDHATRPEHRKRDGTRYLKRPRPGQKGLKDMPRPPREADGTWAFNCRCYLSPILA